MQVSLEISQISTAWLRRGLYRLQALHFDFDDGRMQSTLIHFPEQQHCGQNIQVWGGGRTATSSNPSREKVRSAFWQVVRVQNSLILKQSQVESKLSAGLFGCIFDICIYQATTAMDICVLDDPHARLRSVTGSRTYKLGAIVDGDTSID